MVALYLSTLFLLMMTKVAISLKCHQTDIETGETNIIEDDDFIFCTVFPSIMGSTKSFSAGLKIEELDKPVGDFFEDNDSVYQLLSICLFEKYDWPNVWNAKFKRVKRIPDVEYSLRCICNIDLCNSSDFFTNHVNFLAQSE